MNILLGVTGSVASRLHPKLKLKLENFGKVKSVGTKSCHHFCDVSDFVNESEFSYFERTDRVLHIDLRNWADILVIAPISANTLAKISNGYCDDLLTNVARAWDFNKKFIVAPAMNSKMWNHPITAEQINKISSWGIEVVYPQSKLLVCKEEGIGAMAQIDSIIERINYVST
jgi:phosphopantothenoylcysteine decarboxylase